MSYNNYNNSYSSERRYRSNDSYDDRNYSRDTDYRRDRPKRERQEYDDWDSRRGPNKRWAGENDYGYQTEYNYSNSNDDSWSSNRSNDQTYQNDYDSQNLLSENLRGDEGCTIFVGGLPTFITEFDIKENLGHYRLKARDIRIVRKKDPGSNRGFAFVEFYSAGDAKRWMNQTKGILNFCEGINTTLSFSRSEGGGEGGEVGGAGSPLKNVPDTPPVICKGDWKCFKCGCINFRRRERCFKCKLEREETDYEVVAQDGSDYIGIMPTETMLIRGLNNLTDEARVKQVLFYATKVQVKDVFIARNCTDQLSAGFGFIQLGSSNDSVVVMDAIREAGHPLQVDGSPVQVNYSKVSFRNVIGALSKRGFTIRTLKQMEGEEWVGQDDDGDGGGWSGGANNGDDDDITDDKDIKNKDGDDDYRKKGSSLQPRRSSSALLPTPIGPASPILGGNNNQSYKSTPTHQRTVQPSSSSSSSSYRHSSSSSAKPSSSSSSYSSSAAKASSSSSYSSSAAKASSSSSYSSSATKPSSSSSYSSSAAKTSSSSSSYSSSAAKASSSSYSSPSSSSDAPVTPVKSHFLASPDSSRYVYDETSGYYYDSVTDLYYDKASQYFYDNKTSCFLYWDDTTRSYVEVPNNNNNNSVVAGDDGSAVDGNGDDAFDRQWQRLTNDDEDKMEKAKQAKKIALEMEKWAKQQNVKKDGGFKKPLPILAPPRKGGSLADVGFNVLSKTERPKIDIKLGKDDSNNRPHNVLSKLVDSYGDSDSDDESSSAAASAQKELLALEEKMTDYAKMTCLLCKRAFTSVEMLKKHKMLSDLHKTNLNKYKEKLSSKVTTAI